MSSLHRLTVIDSLISANLRNNPREMAISSATSSSSHLSDKCRSDCIALKCVCVKTGAWFNIRNNYLKNTELLCVFLIDRK